MSDEVPKLVESRPVSRTMPGRNGGTLIVGGTKGGRKPDAWKAKMAELADYGAKALKTADVLKDPKHELFMVALKFVAEQAHGQASKRVELAGDPDAPLVVEVTFPQAEK